MTWLTQGKSFREKRADWPTGALGLARAVCSLDAAESVDLPQMSRGGTCWGGQGCQEQPPIWWIPRSARRRKSIKAGARASSLPDTRGAAQQQALPARRPSTTHHGQWCASPLTLPPSHCLSPSPTPCRLRKVREPRSLLSVGLSIRGGNQPVYGFVTSFNKYLLILNYRASTSGLQK